LITSACFNLLSSLIKFASYFYGFLQKENRLGNPLIDLIDCPDGRLFVISILHVVDSTYPSVVWTFIEYTILGRMARGKFALWGRNFGGG